MSDDTNTEDYSDSRTQVFNHPLMKWAIPCAVLAGLWGAWSAWSYFHPKPAPTVQAAADPAAQRASARPAPSSPDAPAAAAASSPDNRSPIERRMSDLGQKGRIRLAGLISSPKHTSGIIEWVEAGTVVVERLSLDALRSLGVAVLVTEDSVVQLAAGDYRELATPWPLQDMGRVSEARTEAIRGPRQVGAAAPLPEDVVAAAAPPSFVDRPGTLTNNGDGGGMQRRIARMAR